MRRTSTDTQMLRRFGAGAFEPSVLSDYEVDVTVCTSTDDCLDGDVWAMEGVDLSRFAAHPIVLWDHDMSQPIAKASNLKASADKITARVTFPNDGDSPKADEIRKLVKAGIITGVSAGIVPTEVRPLDPRNPGAGSRVVKSILLEFSICAVPADATSGVTNRSNGGSAMATTATGEAGETSAARDVPATAPAVEGEAERVVAASAARQARPRGGAGSVLFKRGLYQVAQLCYLFEELGYHVDIAKYESAIEGDASKVPGMLAALLHDLGDALLAMTAEEVGEALAGLDVEPEEDDDGGLTVEERSHIAAARTPAVRAFRRGLILAKTRAGKKLSAETVRCLREAVATHQDAIADTRAAIVKHKRALASIEGLIDDADDADDADPETQVDDPDDAAAERSRRARAAALKARARAA